MRKFRWYAAKCGSKNIVSQSWGDILDFIEENDGASFKGHQTKAEALAWVENKDAEAKSLERRASDLLAKYGYNSRGER